MLTHKWGEVSEYLGGGCFGAVGTGMRRKCRSAVRKGMIAVVIICVQRLRYGGSEVDHFKYTRNASKNQCPSEHRVYLSKSSILVLTRLGETSTSVDIMSACAWDAMAHPVSIKLPPYQCHCDAL